MTETRRDLPRDPLRCVLVPTDFSQGATLAVRRALRLPLAPRAKVLLLHVGSADEVPATLRKPIAAEAKRKLSQALATARRQAESIGAPTSRCVRISCRGSRSSRSSGGHARPRAT